MRRLLSALALGTAVAGGMFPGRADTLERTANGDDVSVGITSPFSQLPPGGCVPFRVNIRNDRNTPGTWHLFFQGIANTSGFQATDFGQDLTVAPNTSSTFDVLVPLPMVPVDRGGTTLNVGVKGPGFDNSSVYRGEFFAYLYTNNSKSRVPFTIIGKAVLGSVGLGPLESYCTGQGWEFYGSQVDPSNLPADWRAYSGVANVILRDDEWLALTSLQRQAVCDYVSQGGHLALLTSDDPELKAPYLQLPEADGKPGPYGFGNLTLDQSAGFPPDASSLYGTIIRNAAYSAQNIDQNFSTWRLRPLVGTIAVNGAFILSFVLLFGILVGPVNLFVLARGPKRFRLFWTTPVISLAACFALSAGILITDGLGGRGEQMIAVYCLPGVNREAVIQEEVARTALLFSNQWSSDQDYLITPISARVMTDALGVFGSHVYVSRGDVANSPDTYHQEGNGFSGNWFRSRSVSGQYLQAVRPSRSVLTVLNPPALDAVPDAPVVLSSFPQELTKVFLLDAQWHYWTCDHLQPGRKQTCTACTGRDFNLFWNDACAYAGGKLRPLLSRVRDRPGTFYATGLPSASDRLATLDEIRWHTTKAIYLGPWASTPAPEGAP